MDEATKTMIENLEKNYGKSITEWIKLVEEQMLTRHGEILSYLKQNHGMTHGYANLVAHLALKSSSTSSAPEELLLAQYKGKEHFLPLYHTLLEKIAAFGEDFEILPKKTYVSLKRAKQFALLIPATKTRFEIGLFLKGAPSSDLLKAEKQGSMCSHKLFLSSIEEITPEVMELVCLSFQGAK